MAKWLAEVGGFKATGSTRSGDGPEVVSGESNTNSGIVDMNHGSEGVPYARGMNKKTMCIH